MALKKGDKIRAACIISGTLFALDLIGEGPTARTLEHDVPVNSSIEFEPGYLLGSSILDYFKKDKIDLCITV